MNGMTAELSVRTITSPRRKRRTMNMENAIFLVSRIYRHNSGRRENRERRIAAPLVAQ
jgi:hypothetical protein